MGFSSQSQPEPEPETRVAGTKVLETFTEEFEIGSRLITLETRKIARFANGAVVLGMDETRVLSTVCSAKGNAVKDFSLLTALDRAGGKSGNKDAETALTAVVWVPGCFEIGLAAQRLGYS